MKKQSGFTLIEAAMVLIIVGLLLGGALQGNELLQSARVRNQIALQEGLKGAFLAFQDRFRAYPGDFSLATSCISGATINGDGNGRIELPQLGRHARRDCRVGTPVARRFHHESLHL